MQTAALSRPLIAAAACLALAGYEIPLATAAPAAPALPEVGVFEVQPSTVTLTTELPGRTAAYLVAEVRPQVDGIIQQRAFTEGGRVEAGQLLYQIDPASYQAAVESAQAALDRDRARLKTARLKAERYQRLLASKSVSQEDHDDAVAALAEARATVAVSQAALRAARISLDYTRVTAPISGLVGRSTVTPGALVTAYQRAALATVRQLDPIYVDLTQSSAELLRLKRALRSGGLQAPEEASPTVDLILEDGSRYTHQGRLQFSEVSVDAGTGSITLRAVFPNPDHELLPGMFVRALVQEGTKQAAILVPQQGVSHNAQGQATALVLNGAGNVEARVLTVERAVDNRWLVADGLAAGDRLIVEGTQKVRPGAEAQAAAAEPDQAAAPTMGH